jgi:gliding motility-associated-like protein
MLRSFSHLLIALVFILPVKAAVAERLNKDLPAKPKKSGFRENKGQVHDQFQKARPDILFSGQEGLLSFHLKADGISYQLSRVDSWRQPEPLPPHIKTKRSNEPQPEQITFYRLDVRWLNINPAAAVVKGPALESYDNFYSESCSEGALQVKSYAEILYQQLYPGIDLKWYQKDGHLKYDFIVSAGADYHMIEFDMQGATKLRLGKRKELIITTPLGDITEEAPYTEQNGRPLKSEWVINGKHVSFHISGLDKSQPLTIDPLIRFWGTYFGGAQDDQGCASACDASGNIYFTGETRSLANIATSGSHQTVYGGAQPSISSPWGDAFLSKFDPSGNLLWSTYYGGSGSDYSVFCMTAANGDVYMTGATTTTVSGVIATPGAHQVVAGGGVGANTAGDSFLAKFNSMGTRIWGTYYGGNAAEWASEGGCIDNSGNVYMTGVTNSTNSIATGGSHQSVLGGSSDAFFVKFNSNGARQWATYYGGGANDYAYMCSVDALNNVYFTGQTSSNAPNIIATPGSHQPTYGGGMSDGFLVKFNSSGIRLWGTYYGGTAGDNIYGCETYNNVVYASGTTDGNNGIATPASHQPVNAGVSMQDGFLVKFDDLGSRQWSTYYGGIGIEDWAWVTLDLNGDVYLSGSTTTNAGNAIATSCTYQDAYGGGFRDAYLAKFTPGGQRLWGTYYGGPGSEEWAYCTTDALGNVIISGKSSTNSGYNVASPGSYQPMLNGLSDGFVAKFDGCKATPPPNTTPPQNLLVCLGNSSLLTTTVTCAHWFASAVGGQTLGLGPGYITPPVVANTTYYVEETSCGTVSPRTAIEVTVLPLPLVVAGSNPPVICSGQGSSLSATGANTYTWSSPFSASEGTGSLITVSPPSTAVYTVLGNDGSCSGSSTVAVSIVPLPNPVIGASNNKPCTGATIILTGSGADSYSWQPAGIMSAGTGSMVSAQPLSNTIVTLTGANISGTVSCTRQSTLSVTLLPYAPAFVSSGVTICRGQSAVLTAAGGSSYSWAPAGVLLDAGNNMVIASPTVTTVYTITVVSDNACPAKKTVTVTVNPKPELFAGRDTTFDSDELMVITATGTGRITWISGENMSCADCPRTEIFPIRKTCYVAEAVNEYGCTETDEVCVDVGLDYAIYVPNTFSPNQDGLNDLFLVSGFGISNVHLQVFDRWGEQMFETNDVQTGWNGGFRGQPCKIGTYTWKVSFNATSGKVEERSGHVNLLR